MGSLKDLGKIVNAEPSYALPEDAELVEIIKHSLCREVVVYLKKNKISQASLCRELNVDPARMSEIVHYKIASFTIDRLLQIVLQIRPGLKIKIS